MQRYGRSDARIVVSRQSISMLLPKVLDVLVHITHIEEFDDVFAKLPLWSRGLAHVVLLWWERVRVRDGGEEHLYADEKRLNTVRQLRGVVIGCPRLIVGGNNPRLHEHRERHGLPKGKEDHGFDADEFPKRVYRGQFSVHHLVQ